jgi:hypothetical protein
MDLFQFRYTRIIKNFKENKNDILFSRTFYPSETKEIRLYGLNGKDVFNISGESNKSIKIRVVGGPDKDLVYDQSIVKSGGKNTLIYEESPKSEISTLSECKRIQSWNKSLFNYDRNNFSYNTYLPIPYLGFDQYIGIEFSLGVVFTQHNYRTRDYSSRHTI